MRELCVVDFFCVLDRVEDPDLVGFETRVLGKPDGQNHDGSGLNNYG